MGAHARQPWELVRKVVASTRFFVRCPRRRHPVLRVLATRARAARCTPTTTRSIPVRRHGRALDRDDEPPLQGPDVEANRRHPQQGDGHDVYHREQRLRSARRFVPLPVGAVGGIGPHGVPVHLRRDPEGALLLCVRVVHGRPQRDCVGRWQAHEHVVLRPANSLRIGRADRRCGR